MSVEFPSKAPCTVHTFGLSSARLLVDMNFCIDNILQSWVRAFGGSIFEWSLKGNLWLTWFYRQPHRKRTSNLKTMLFTLTFFVEAAIWWPEFL